MFNALTVRIAQGKQYIPNPRTAKPVGLRGLPVIADRACASGCKACTAVCPSQAIALSPLRIDLGACVLCGDCAPACPQDILSFSAHYRIAGTDRASLVVSAQRPVPDAIQVAAALHQHFGRSLKLRSVSAGGCNGCELEINALSNVNFDLGRYGIDIVASPRHADALVLSGPITRNMADALQQCWDAMPEPRFVIAVGACAISSGAFAGSPTLERGFLDRVVPTLYVPGCPAHPLSFVCGILDLLGIASD
jgi:Ni,Fe-hydrogenase III small subunit/NAD-dependent dihydropyrimidine dehydrogenase PreA subunit